LRGAPLTAASTPSQHFSLKSPANFFRILAADRGLVALRGWNG
jgi:hypothetical protein